MKKEIEIKTKKASDSGLTPERRKQLLNEAASIKR